MRRTSDYVMLDVSSHIYGWLEWIWNKFINYFEQLYHSNVGVFYCMRWIGMCIEIVVLLLYVDGYFYDS